MVAALDSKAQEEFDSLLKKQPEDPRMNEFLITAILEYNIPQQDYADKFYGHPGLGAGFYWKSKNDLYLGADLVFFFSDRIKQTDILSNITNSLGYVIGGDGEPANIEISQRGYNLTFLRVGKLLVHSGFWHGNIHSGLVGMIGGGLFQYKYRIVDNTGTVPGLSEEYKKGYDELTNGFCLTPMLGYFYFDKKKYLNFFLAVEYRIAWTQNRRDWNFNSMERDDSLRNDQAWTIKLGWFFPIRKKQSRDYYFF